MRSLVLAVLALAALAGAARPGPAGEARPVARIGARPVARVEVLAPSFSPFTLRATVPVPKEASSAGRPPALGVVQPGRGSRVVPAQVATVSRYPTGEPDVVWILARIELEEGTRARTPLRLDIVPLDPAPAGGAPPADDAPETPPSVRALLDPEAPLGLAVQTRDVFGNRYVARIDGREGPGFGSLRWTLEGPVARGRRAYGTLVPDGASSADGDPLPHLMGVHAYLTEWAGEELLSLDLRVNNGAISPERPGDPLETTLGIVYWQSLELLLPKGWTAVPDVADPFFGEPREERGHVVVPLVAPNPDGKLHMMPPQAQFHRRLALVPKGLEPHAKAWLRNEGLGFSVRDRENELWSWFNPETARYFPSRDLLASYDFYQFRDLRGRAAARAREASDLAEFVAGLSSGTRRGWYVEGKVMGWAHPWFIRQPYGFGGEGIATFEGHRVAASASIEGYCLLELLHRMNACRQPETAYDRFGDPVGYRAWLDDEGRIPFDFRTNGGVVMPPFRLPMSSGDPPSAQVLAVVERGLRPGYDQGTPYLADGKTPDADDNLFAWWPHDDAHLVRYTKNTKALAWLGNDALAKDDLRLSAELFHLMFHESEHVRASWSPGITLRILERMAAAHPHQGVPVGRQHGWGIEAMCAAYSLAGDEWRAETLPWFRRVARLLLEAAQPSGLIQRMDNERLFDRRYVSTQVFESLFLIHAIHAMNESVFRGVDDPLRIELEALCVRAIDYLYWGPPFQRTAADWQPDPEHPTIFHQGPRNYIAVAPNDGWKSPVFSDAERWGPSYLPADGLDSGLELFHCWQALSYAAQITDPVAGAGLDNRYLRRTLDCWTQHASFGALLDDLYAQANDPTYDNASNWVGFAGKLQALGVR